MEEPQFENHLVCCHQLLRYPGVSRHQYKSCIFYHRDELVVHNNNLICNLFGLFALSQEYSPFYLSPRIFSSWYFSHEVTDETDTDFLCLVFVYHLWPMWPLDVTAGCHKAFAVTWQAWAIKSRLKLELQINVSFVILLLSIVRGNQECSVTLSNFCLKLCSDSWCNNGVRTLLFFLFVCIFLLKVQWSNERM